MFLLLGHLSHKNKMPFRLKPQDSLENKASRTVKVVAAAAIGLVLLWPGKTQDSSIKIKNFQGNQLTSEQIEEKNLNYVLEEMKRDYPNIYYLVDPQFELKKQEFQHYLPHIPYGEEFPFYKDYEIPEDRK